MVVGGTVTKLLTKSPHEWAIGHKMPRLLTAKADAWGTSPSPSTATTSASSSAATLGTLLLLLTSLTSLMSLSLLLLVARVKDGALVAVVFEGEHGHVLDKGDLAIHCENIVVH